MALTATHRGLAIAAILWNAVFVGLGLALEPESALIVAAVSAPPLGLLALRGHPGVFRLLAGLIGFAYVGTAVIAGFFVGALLWYLPSGLLLVWAALLPRLGDDPRYRWQRCLCRLGLRVTVLIVVPVAAVLLFIVL
jgi:hypothetical protein